MAWAIAMLAVPAWAQNASAPAVLVSTSITAAGTYTDTRRETGSGFSGGEFIAELSPGLRMSARTGRVQGSLDYTLTGLRYSQNSEPSNLRNSLNASLAVVAVENWAFVDAWAAITQQSLTPFGEQSAAGSSRYNANLTEVYDVSVAPSVRGSFWGLADYNVQVRASATNAQDSIASDSTTLSGSASLSSTNRGVLGWGLSASRQRVDYRATGTTGTGRMDATVKAAPNPDLLLTANVGRETTDVVGDFKRTYDVQGFGVTWRPSERTNVDFKTDRRYFGRSWSLSLGYRTGRTVWAYNNVNDTIDGGGPTGVGRPLTLYDLYFNQFASVQPDPALREQLVLNFLRAIGANPNDSIGGGFLIETKTLQHRQDLSFAWLGKRTNFNLQAYSNDNRAIDKKTNQATGDPVVTRGYLGTVSYQLSPVSSLSLTGNQTRTLSNQTNTGNDLKSVALSWSSQPIRRTSVSLGAGYTVFDSETDAYRESFVRASVSLQF